MISENDSVYILHVTEEAKLFSCLSLSPGIGVLNFLDYKNGTHILIQGVGDF
jgi:hypothetical protein